MTAEDHPVRPAGPAGRVPRRTALARLAAASAVLTVLLGADAVYLQLGRHQGGDRTNNFQLSDAGTVFIAAGLLLVLTLVVVTVWAHARRTVS